jgi:hypothetical protein
MKKNTDYDGEFFWSIGSDVQAILNLLRGTTSVDPTAFWGKYRYLSPQEEREGRKALAALLRSRERPAIDAPPLLRNERQEALLNEACHGLADLIDPDCNGPRKIVFKNRKGRLPQYDADLEIIHSIQDRVKGGLTVEKAVAEAAEEHKLSESRVLKLWSNRESIRRKRYGDRTSP